MSDLDLEPLVRGDADPLERTVLGSARADAPSHAAKTALLAALAPAPPPSNLPRAAPSLLRRLGARHAAPGFALVVGASAVALLVIRRDEAGGRAEPNAVVVEAAPSASVVTPAIAETERAVVPSAVADPPALPAPPESDLGGAAPARHAPRRHPVAANAPRAVAGPSADPEDDSLAREIARIGAARSALAAGEPVRTLALLDAYDAEFPRGAFTVEVSVLRIEALARSGHVEEARRLGARFLTQHPDGAFARRVTATLQGISPSTTFPLASPRD